MELLPAFVITIFVLLLIATGIFYGIGEFWSFFAPPFVNVTNSITNVINNSYVGFVTGTQNFILEIVVGLTIVFGLGEIIIGFEMPDRMNGYAGVASLFIMPVIWVTFKWVDVAYILPFFASNGQFLTLFDSVWFIVAIEIFLAVATIVNFRSSEQKQTIIYSEHQ